MIEGRRHLGDHARVPIGIAADEETDPRAPRRLGERGERRPAFQARALRIDEDRVEVVEEPERVVAPPVGLLPEVEHLRPLDSLLPRLDTETSRCAGRHVTGCRGSA